MPTDDEEIQRVVKELKRLAMLEISKSIVDLISRGTRATLDASEVYTAIIDGLMSDAAVRVRDDREAECLENIIQILEVSYTRMRRIAKETSNQS